MFNVTTEIYENFVESFVEEGTTEEILFIGFASETGEVLSERMREIRKGESRSKEILDELSDVLWYISAITKRRGFSVVDLMTHSILKLEDRALNGKKSKTKGYLTLKNKKGDT